MRWLALTAILVGCGGGSEAGDVLAGTRWIVSYSGVQCSEGIAFGRDQGYEDIVLCTLTDGSNGAQLIAGTYAIDGHTLTLVNTSASCPQSDIIPVVTATFSVGPDSLTMSGPAGATVYERLSPSSGSGAVTFGCFDADGNFTPMPVHSI